MKKGGISEVNSFIAVTSTSKSSPKRVSTRNRTFSQERQQTKPADVSSQKIKTSTSSRSSSVTRSSTKLINKPSPSKKITNNDPPKAPVSQKPRTTSRPSLTKAQSMGRDSQTTKTNTTNSDPKPRRTSLIEDKRGTSLGKITMEDVYKRRLSRATEEKSNSSSRRSSILSTSTSRPGTAKETTSESVHQKRELSTHLAEINEDRLTADKDYEYEDDFEDYESDFDSYSESQESESQNESESGNDHENRKVTHEEEKKMDSGSYDLYRSQQQKNQLEMIKEALHKENTEVQRLNSPVCQTRTKQRADISDGTDFLSNFDTKSLQNFTSAKKRQQNSTLSNQIKSRGEKLLQMVTLDVMQYTLYEMIPVPYDVFMRSYARKDTSQAYVQTNEDNMSSEIQTEEIYFCSKWTQHPVEISKNMQSEEMWQAMLGVGDDNTTAIQHMLPDFNARRLNDFMKTVGEELIALLEEESAAPDSPTSKSNTITKISESISCINCNCFSFLQSRPIILTLFDPHSQFRLLTVHGYSEKSDDNDRCSILCVWNIRQPLTPKTILKSYGSVTCCSFVSDDSSFIVAGHGDGSLCVWDLRDNALYSEKFKIGNIEVPVRSPSYNTAEILKNSNHNSTVINVDSVKSIKDEVQLINEFKTETVFSIEEENFLIIWTLSRSFNKSNDIGLAPWSKIKFFVNQVIDITRLLPKSYSITTLRVSSESKILLGTNTGLVLKCSSYDKKCKIYGKHSPDVKDQSKVTCLEVCPYDDKYFVVGYGNGNIRLYNYNYTEPVSNLEQRDVSSVSIRSLQWLWNKHNYILSLDLHSTLRIYRLSSEDSLVHTVQIKDINSAIISPFNENVNEAIPYLVLSSVKGYVEVHKFISTMDKIDE